MKKGRNEIIQSIKDTLDSIVPNAKIILYGSRSRGDAQENSDWDLIILLDKDRITPQDFDRISYPIHELGWKFGEQFSPKLYTVNEWKQRNFTLFYKNVEKEGVIL